MRLTNTLNGIEEHFEFREYQDREGKLCECLISILSNSILIIFLGLFAQLR